MFKLSKANQIMLGAVLVLAMIALWQPGTAPELPQPSPITQLTSDEIHHLQLERPGMATLRFRKDDAGWRMTSPYEVAAHHFALQTLTSLVSADSVRQLPAEPGKLGQYGLETPVARVVVNNHRVLEVGGTEALSRQRYIKVDDTIYLVNDSWQRLLQSASGDFVSLSLLPETAIIASITTPQIQLKKQGEEWQLQPPQSHSLDQVQFLLDNWSYQQALSVQAYEARDGGESVTIGLADGSQIRFIIVSHQPLILARPDLGLQYTLGQEAARELLQLPALPEPASPPEAKP